MAEQREGCYPRVNGQMIQSQQYNGAMISIVGKLLSADTLQASDSTAVTVDTAQIEGDLINNPDMAVEIIGQVTDATHITGFVIRELSVDTDMDLYNQFLALQHSPEYSQYFPLAEIGVSND